VVRHVAARGEPCASLVIHRDGRWWPTERDGLRDAVENLIADGVVPTTFRVVVVEVRKNHMPVRLFTHGGERSPATSAATGRAHVDFVNPLPGSYLILGDDRATGKLGRRTTGPNRNDASN
jgi:hypothetical protein